jgi:hypothetical protein
MAFDPHRRDVADWDNMSEATRIGVLHQDLGVLSAKVKQIDQKVKTLDAQVKALQAFNVQLQLQLQPLLDILQPLLDILEKFKARDGGGLELSDHLHAVNGADIFFE